MKSSLNRDPNLPFYGWSLIIGLISFGMYLLWHFGLIHKLIAQDITYLSSIILVLFLVVSVYLGTAAWRISRQYRYVQDVVNNGSESIEPDEESWIHEHLALTKRSRSDTGNEGASLTPRLIERVHRGHAPGWFLSDLLLRLGLIGTVIGFVFMLGAVYELKPSDISVLRDLMTTLGSGMQVALYTTLCGLGASVLISIQCKWLDRCADALISEVIKLSVEAS